MHTFLTSRKFIVVVIVAILIGMGVFFSVKVMQKKTQSISQAQKGNTLPTQGREPTMKPLLLYFSQKGSTTDLSSLSLKKDETMQLDIYIDAHQYPLNGFDITVSTGDHAIVTQILDGNDTGKFSVEIFKDTTKNRFAKVEVESKNTTGLLNIASFVIQGVSKGSGTIQIEHATITSINYTKSLPTTSASIPYTVE